jgi:hypothetical protein
VLGEHEENNDNLIQDNQYHREARTENLPNTRPEHYLQTKPFRQIGHGRTLDDVPNEASLFGRGGI